MRSRGKSLAWAAIAAWAICLSLGIKATLSGTPLPPVFVRADPRGGPPTLIDFRSGWNAKSSGLRTGDHLLRLGGRDLTGTGPLGLFVETARAGRAGQEVEVTYQRGSAIASTRIELPAGTWMWPALPLSLTWGALAILILTRSSWARAPRNAFWASIGVALTAPLFGGGYFQTILSATALSLGAAGMAVFGVRFCISFLSSTGTFGAETGEARAARAETWPWIFAALAPLEASRDFGFFLPPAVGRDGFVGAVALSLGYGLWRLTGRVRHVSPIERRQLYWILFGLYWGAAPLTLAALLAITDERFNPLLAGTVALVAILPVVWVFAIYRFSMLDVDRIIGAATTYSVVALLLITVGAYVNSHFLQQGSMMADVAIALLLIGLSVPGYRWLRPSIERLLFPERVRFHRGIERLHEQVGGCTDREQLWEVAGLGLYNITDPLSCAIYVVADGAASEPVFHRGLASPAAIQHDGGLVAALGDRQGCFHLRPRRDFVLTAEERTALQTLQAAVVVPIRQRSRLHSFVVLGEKLSEDIYTASELAAFDQLATTISRSLDRMDRPLRAAS